MSEYTVSDLKDMARKIPIKGFSKMKKAELISALKAEGYLQSKKASPKKKSPSPKDVVKGMRRDFNKMVKPDIIKLIKELDPSYKLKSTLKKAELIEIAESLVGKVVSGRVSPKPLPDVPIPAPVVVPGPEEVNFEKMTVVQLKEFAMEKRGIKIGSMKKADIIAVLRGENCDPEVGSYCKNPSESCDIRFKSCVGNPEEKLVKIAINGHNVVGTQKSIDELKKKMEVVKKPSPKKPSPKKKISSELPIEDVLSDITRPPISTTEFRNNLERLKICLGLMSR